MTTQFDHSIRIGTKAYKLEHFDHIKSERDKFELTVYDLVNSRFSVGVRLWCKDFEHGARGCYQVKMSWRAMPLYLVTFQTAGQPDHAEVLTDDEIQDGYRAQPTGIYWRIVMMARNELVQKQTQKEQKTS